MRDDERALLREFNRRGGGPTKDVFLRYLGEEMGMNAKRVAYIAEKWTSRGWYDYGVNVTMGWLTDEGKRVAELARAGAV